GTGNVISGNVNGAILFGGDNAAQQGVLMQGNLIGLDVTGTTALPNGREGVETSSFNNTIGGTTPAARNIISANKERGVWITSSFPVGNLVQGNYIGTDVSGTKAMGNGFEGILAEPSQTTVGGTASGARNVIGANAGAGIGLNFGAVIVQNNLIGTDVTG